MNTTAMREGRERARQAKRNDHERARLSFVEWLRCERVAFTQRASAEELHGRASQQFRTAHEHWSMVLSSMPIPPPDHAWPKGA